MPPLPGLRFRGARGVSSNEANGANRCAGSKLGLAQRELTERSHELTDQQRLKLYESVDRLATMLAKSLEDDAVRRARVKLVRRRASHQRKS